MVGRDRRRVDGPLNGDGSSWPLKISGPQTSRTGRNLRLITCLNTDVCGETPSVALTRSVFFVSCRKKVSVSDMNQISPGMRPGLSPEKDL